MAGPVATHADPRRDQPTQGWLANWNNLPSAGWTSGDGTARKRTDGAFFRAGLLFPLVRALARKPTFAGLQDLIHRSGTTAQQFPVARGRLAAAARGLRSGRAATVLGVLLRWDGSYARTAPDGTVDARRGDVGGLPRPARAPDPLWLGPGVGWLADEGALGFLHPGYHAGAPYHYFDASHLQSYALRTQRRPSYRIAAERAFDALAQRFGSTDPAKWRIPRPMFDFEGLARRLAPAAALLRTRDVGAAGRARALTGTGSRTTIGGEARFRTPRARSRLRAMNSTRTLMNGGGWWRRWLGGRRREIHYRGAHIAGGQAVTPAVALSAYRHLM